MNLLPDQPGGASGVGLMLDAETKRGALHRLHALAKRLLLAGLAALSLGVFMVVASLAHSTGTPAFADSAPYELYCPGTPVGNIALNDVTTTGSITPRRLSPVISST